MPITNSTNNTSEYIAPESALRRLLGNISSPFSEPTAILGFPGVGKTSILRFLATTPFSELRSFLSEPFKSHPERLAPVLIQCREVRAGVNLFERVFTALQACLLKIDPALAQTTGAHAAANDATSGLNSMLDTCDAAMIRPVLLLDDFDQAFKRLDPSDARHLRPRRGAIMVMAIESPLEVPDADLDYYSPFFQAMDHVWIKGLSVDEAANLIAVIARAPKGDAEYLASYLIRYPVILKKAAQILRDERARLTAATQSPMAPELRRLLLRKVSEELQPLFDYYWNRLDPQQKDTLKGLTADSKPGNDVSAIHLEKRGLIDYITPDRAQIRGELFQQFVLDRTPGPSDLSDIETHLYDLLRSRQFETCSIAELFHAAWSDAGVDSTNAARRVQVAISRLRQKIEDQGRGTIVSVRRHGYRLELSER